MPAATTMMALMGAAQAGSALGNGIGQSGAIQAQGAFQKQMYDTNARLADMQAQDAVDQGEREADIQGKKTAAVVGSQRAALAASGVDVNSGSAAAVQSDAAQTGAIDVQTIRNNAWRQAWGYKVQAANYSGQGAMAQLSAENSSRNTLLTGGMQALGYGAKGYYDWKKG